MLIPAADTRDTMTHTQDWKEDPKAELRVKTETSTDPQWKQATWFHPEPLQCPRAPTGLWEPPSGSPGCPVHNAPCHSWTDGQREGERRKRIQLLINDF